MKRLVLAFVCLSSSVGAAACATDGTPWGGEALPGEPLRLHTANEGVHPDRSVLDDPANPFALGKLTDATIWQLQSNGGAVAAFYAWATANAHGANGERQYYAALDVMTIYERRLAAEHELPAIRAW